MQNMTFNDFRRIHKHFYLNVKLLIYSNFGQYHNLVGPFLSNTIQQNL